MTSRSLDVIARETHRHLRYSRNVVAQKSDTIKRNQARTSTLYYKFVDAR